MNDEPLFLGNWITQPCPEMLEEELAEKLLQAIHSSDLKQVQSLIAQGINLQFQSDNHDLPIVEAVQVGNIEIIKVLILTGSDANSTSDSGVTIIDMAIRGGCLDTVKLLVESGADIHSIDEGGETALYHAAWCQKQEIYDYLYPYYLDDEYRQWLEKIRLISPL
jgi:ankyrin repeat protein